MHRTGVSPPQRAKALTLELSVLSTIVLFAWHVAHSELLRTHPNIIGGAIAFDLTLTAAACHWFLGVRRAGLTAWTTIPVMVVGLALCRLLLSKELMSGGVLLIVAGALVESSAIVLTAARIRTLVRAYRAAKREGVETFDALETGLLAVMPSLPVTVAAWIRLEIQLWSLCLVGWTIKRRPANGPNVFTHHKQAHWFAIVGILAFIMVNEAAAAHLWLHATKHMTAKWILLAVHVYGLIWLLGDAQATRIYRSSLRHIHGVPSLDIRVGIRGNTSIPLSNITRVTQGTWKTAGVNEALLALQGVANIKIELVEPNRLKRPLGAPKPIHTLLLHVDEPESFKTAVEQAQAA